MLSMVVGCQTGDATNKTMAEPSPASAQSSAIFKDVSNADFASLMSSLENPVVLDVRTPEEWNEGHLEGALVHSAAEVDASEACQKTDVSGLDILPAIVDLSAAEIELADVDAREFRLQTALQMVAHHYDYIFIDCPPSLGLLTINALCAADCVIVPLQCEFYALEGLSQLMRTIEMVQQGLNRNLIVQGIVLTMFDSRNKLSEMVANDVRAHFGNLVYHTVIPRNVRISEAPSFGQPVLIYDLKCSGSQAYVALAAELLSQEKEAA